MKTTLTIFILSFYALLLYLIVGTMQDVGTIGLIPSIQEHEVLWCINAVLGIFISFSKYFVKEKGDKE